VCVGGCHQEYRCFPCTYKDTLVHVERTLWCTWKHLREHSRNSEEHSRTFQNFERTFENNPEFRKNIREHSRYSEEHSRTFSNIRHWWPLADWGWPPTWAQTSNSSPGWPPAPLLTFQNQLQRGTIAPHCSSTLLEHINMDGRPPGRTQLTILLMLLHQLLLPSSQASSAMLWRGPDVEFRFPP